MSRMEKLTANPEIIFREEADEAFLFNPEDGNLSCINELGVFIWKHCDGKHISNEIIDLIHKDYQEIPKTEIRRDFNKFVNQLKKLGYLRVKK